MFDVTHHNAYHGDGMVEYDAEYCRRRIDLSDVVSIAKLIVQCLILATQVREMCQERRNGRMPQQFVK
ncbi:hypothetical protein WT39_29260 [Burkholderia territorii]|nr:hypothetical protein WT39_29260 [Burkholderia territorii]